MQTLRFIGITPLAFSASRHTLRRSYACRLLPQPDTNIGACCQLIRPAGIGRPNQ
jgi:hypothetical protein